MDVDMEGQGMSQFSSPDQCTLSEETDQGWVSWAWSFVPAIISTEEENEEGLYQPGETGGITSNPQQHTLKDPIVSIGFYCTKASVTFKVLLSHPIFIKNIFLYVIDRYRYIDRYIDIT